jgi:quercetin dioxygenase-like cupin family protein
MTDHLKYILSLLFVAAPFVTHAQSSGGDVPRFMKIVEPKSYVVKNEDIVSRPVNDKISAQGLGGKQTRISQTRIKKDGRSPLHNHPEEELIVVISGSMIARTTSGDVLMKPGDVFMIEPYAVHQVIATEDVYFVEAFGPGDVIGVPSQR